MNSDQDNYRRSDPSTSKKAAAKKREQQRAAVWEEACAIVRGEFEWLGAPVTFEGTCLITRNMIPLVTPLYHPYAIPQAHRRRFSDFLIQRFKGGKRSPVIHFDLFSPVYGTNGKVTELDGAELLTLTAKGRLWAANPALCNWFWATPKKGVSVPGFGPNDP